jgi:hypothetical protein
MSTKRGDFGARCQTASESLPSTTIFSLVLRHV